MQLTPCLFVSQSRVGWGPKDSNAFIVMKSFSNTALLAISQGYKVLPKEVIIIIMINHCIDFEGRGLL